MIDISIIIPIYNSERYLYDCLNSILFQKYKNFECILIDDGSTDCSSAICDEFGSLDKRFVVVHKKNGGVSDARNTGLQLANGEWVCFIDSDDKIESGFLERLYECVGDTDLIVGGCKWVYANKIIEQNYEYRVATVDRFFFEFDKYRSSLEFTVWLHAPFSKLYKAALIKKNNLHFDSSISLGEDYIFNLNYFTLCSTITTVSDSMYLYRVVDNSLSRNFTIQTKNSIFYLCDYTKRYVANNELILNKNSYLCFAYNNYYSLVIKCCNSKFGKADVEKIFSELTEKVCFSELRKVVFKCSCLVFFVMFMLKVRNYSLIFFLAKIRRILKRDNC